MSLKYFYVRIYEENKHANKQGNKIPLFSGPLEYVQLKESKLNKIQIHNQTKVTPRYDYSLYLFWIYRE